MWAEGVGMKSACYPGAGASWSLRTVIGPPILPPQINTQGMQVGRRGCLHLGWGANHLLTERRGLLRRHGRQTKIGAETRAAGPGEWPVGVSGPLAPRPEAPGAVQDFGRRAAELEGHQRREPGDLSEGLARGASYQETPHLGEHLFPRQVELNRRLGSDS